MELILLVIAFGAIVIWYSWNKTATAKYESKPEVKPEPVQEQAKPEETKHFVDGHGDVREVVSQVSEPTTPIPVVVEKVTPEPAVAKKTRGRRPGTKAKPAAAKASTKSNKTTKPTKTKKK